MANTQFIFYEQRTFHKTFYDSFYISVSKIQVKFSLATIEIDSLALLSYVSISHSALQPLLDGSFAILRFVIFFVLSEKCNSISSNVHPSVSGKILYINIKPIAMTTQLNSATPGNESAVSKL